MLTQRALQQCYCEIADRIPRMIDTRYISSRTDMTRLQGEKQHTYDSIAYQWGGPGGQFIARTIEMSAAERVMTSMSFQTCVTSPLRCLLSNFQRWYLCLWKKHSSGEENLWEEKLSRRQLKEMKGFLRPDCRARPCAKKEEEYVCSQTRVSLCTGRLIAYDYPYYYLYDDKYCVHWHYY